MNTDTKTTMEITLKLTAEEAIWLKSLVQNPPPSPHYESAENAGKRAALFDALPSFPDLYRANVEVKRGAEDSAKDATGSPSLLPSCSLSSSFVDGGKIASSGGSFKKLPLEVGCVVTTNGGQKHTIAEIGFSGFEGIAENSFYHWDNAWPYKIEHAAMDPDRDAVVSVSWPNAEAMRGGEDSQKNHTASSPSNAPTC